MNEMTFGCVIYEAVNIKGGGIRAITVGQQGIVASIPPRATKQYTCPLKKVLAMGPYVSANVGINLKFKTLGVSRESTSDHFVWKATTGQWFEGAPIN
jgi:hypothetical protein